MSKKYRILIEENKDGFAYTRVAARDGVGLEWIEDLCTHLKEKFGYETTRKIDGPAGEILRYLTNGSKNILVVDNDFDGAEIHPKTVNAEGDVMEMAAYLKDILESQNTNPDEA